MPTQPPLLCGSVLRDEGLVRPRRWYVCTMHCIQLTCSTCRLS